jgi:DNA-binding MarR family transcriptional regulator
MWMEKELNKVEWRILEELSKEPASTIWKLTNMLGIPHAEVSDALEELSKRGLVMVTPRGWELTVEAEAVLEKQREEAEAAIRHSKHVVKVPLPSDVERAKVVVKPFKKSSEEGEQKSGEAG